MILITGFEAFDGRTQNGSATLARHFDQMTVGGHEVMSHILPVVWAEVKEYCETTVAQSNATLVLGLGEADCERPRIELEAKPRATGIDNKGTAPPYVADAASMRCTSLTCRAEWFDDLDGSMDVSEDAGAYLCNWFLLHTLQHARVPAGFVHVPIQFASTKEEYTRRNAAAIVRFIEMNVALLTEEQTSN